MNRNYKNDYKNVAQAPKFMTHNPVVKPEDPPIFVSMTNQFTKQRSTVPLSHYRQYLKQKSDEEIVNQQAQQESEDLLLPKMHQSQTMFDLQQNLEAIMGEDECNSDIS
jgi:hypothetical protein